MPTPYDDKVTVLIPEIASACVWCNFTIDGLITDTKYEEFATIPPISVWDCVEYITCSAFLNLWYVLNPIVDNEDPMLTWAEFGSAKKSEECSINFILTEARAPDPLPPFMLTVGFSI